MQPRSKAKVLRLITRMNAGGPALHVLLLSEGLERRGYAVELAAGVCEAAAGDIPAPVPPERRIASLGTLSRSIAPARDARAVYTAWRLMRRVRPDIVHTHTAKAGLIGRVAARLAGVPVVVHTFHGNSLSGYFSPAASRLFCGLERLLARITDRICVVSEQQAGELSGRFRVAPRSKLRVVPLGIDMRGEFALPLPVPTAPLRVGWAGRMVAVKGVPLLTAVIDETARRGLPVQFAVAGDGPESALVARAAARHGSGRVRWAGWRSDVTRFLSECHVLVQTSVNEGTPVALIQGMAAGRPFVATPAGGVVDMVAGAPGTADAGCRWFDNGVLAESAAAFASALERFCREPDCLQRMGAAARRFAAERYGAERLVEDIDRLYRELLEERRAATAQPRVLGAALPKGVPE